MTAGVHEFRERICAAGLSPPDSIEPGRFQRFPGDGKRNGNTAGWCKLFDDGRGGIFGDFSTGAVESWQAKHPRPLTLAEREAFRRNVEEAKAKAMAERQTEHAKAARVASERWQSAKPADPLHSYLVRKSIKPHGIRQEGDRLVIPMRDVAGELHSLQFIGPDGQKRFLTSGRVGGCYFGIGKPNGTLCIAEGSATGASIHEGTGHAVAVAFNSGNLETVARELRGKFPEATIVICADDDYRTDGNPGKRDATKAALVVGGLLAIPDFGDDRPDGATDFNDLAQHAGADAVKCAVASARAPEVSTYQLPASNAIAGDLASVVLRRVSDVEAVPIRWLWPGRIARGKLTMIAGHPGLGKSQLTCAIAAVVTTGGRWPVDGTPCERGAVAMLSAEDDVADTIRPRLEAAGADVAKVEIIDGVIDAFDAAGEPIQRSVSLKADTARLDALFASRTDIAVLIVDPVSAYLGGTDSHVNADVRALLAPLSALAARRQIAVIMVSHLNKGGSTSEALSRVTGSLAFVAAARGAFIVAKDKDDPLRRLFLPAKNNIASDIGGLAFTVASFALPKGIATSRVLWEAQPVTITADEAMVPAPEGGEQTMTEDAVDLLRDMLVGGRVLARDIKRRAGDAGISDKALRSARQKLGIGVSREGFGADTRTYWSLHSCPPDPFVPSSAYRENRAEMGAGGTNGAAPVAVEEF